MRIWSWGDQKLTVLHLDPQRTECRRAEAEEERERCGQMCLFLLNKHLKDQSSHALQLDIKVIYLKRLSVLFLKSFNIEI